MKRLFWFGLSVVCITGFLFIVQHPVQAQKNPQQVIVANTNAIPVPVKDLNTPNKQPFVYVFDAASMLSQSYQVPINKVLVIEYISMYRRCDGNNYWYSPVLKTYTNTVQASWRFLSTAMNVEFYSHTFASERVLINCDPGSLVTFENPVKAVIEGYFNISGYLIEATPDNF